MEKGGAKQVFCVTLKCSSWLDPFNLQLNAMHFHGVFTDIRRIVLEKNFPVLVRIELTRRISQKD